MKSNLVLFIAFSCIALYDAKQREFRCDYTYFPEADGWLKLHDIPSSFQEARLRCHLEGATLASPITVGIGKAMMVMKSKFFNTSALYPETPISVFTGIHSTYSYEDYSSIEGIPLSQIQYKWGKGSPYSDLKGYANNLVMGPDGELSGLDGDNEEYPFICYKVAEKIVQNECGTVDKEYGLNEKLGNCYKFHNVGRSWRDAYKTCAAEGSELVVINGGGEAALLMYMLDFYAVDPKNKPTKGRNDEEYEAPDNEDGALEQFIHVGVTRAENSKWLPLTIQGQTLNEAGYSRVGIKHQDKEGLCYGMDGKGYLIRVNCNTVWYRFVCERKPGKIYCGDDLADDRDDQQLNKLSEN